MKRGTRVQLWYLLPVALILFAACQNPLRVTNGAANTATHIDRDTVTAAAAGSIVINEFVFNHTGSDTHEYVEVYGLPSTDYSDYSIIQIEGDVNSATGTVDSVTAVGTTDASGFYVTPFLSNTFENGTVTLLLVQGFTGAKGDDLDTDNDGVLDVTPWSAIASSVAVSDGGTGDLVYGAPVLGPGYDGASYGPGGASRIPDGKNTGAASDWVRNDFDGAGLPGFSGTPETGEALNTPGLPNRYADPDQPLPLTISEIQGSGERSPYEGTLVVTSGVVTLLTSDGRSFWMQDPAGDGNPATSDGIYVYRGSAYHPVSQGDLVSVTARVSEYVSGAGYLPLTELSSIKDVETVSGGNALPEPVDLTRLPDLSIPDAISFWEPLEGMRVSLFNAPVVGPTSAYGEFAAVARGNARPGSGFYPQNDHLVLNQTASGEVDYNPERIIVDDSSLSEAITAMPGDRVRKLVGVLDYTYGNYKIQPDTVDLRTSHRFRWRTEHRSGSHGGIRVTNLNVENLFDLVDDPLKDDASSTPTPQELETKLQKLTLAIVNELDLPEIIVAEEVENQAILQELGDRVNSKAHTKYRAVSYESSDARGIEVGFLFDERRVNLLDSYQMSGPDVEAAFGPTSASPGREPIVGVFRAGGTKFTVIGNHFKSKGGDEPLFGTNWPPLRPTEVQRKAQARAVRAFVDSLLAANPRERIIVTGDLNDFQFGEPGEGADHPLAILEGSVASTRLTNLILRVQPAERWTYVYDGNSQVLDHMLVSPRLLHDVAGIRILHFNASYPASLASDPSVPYHSSDHDAVELTLRFHRFAGRGWDW